MNMNQVTFSRLLEDIDRTTNEQKFTIIMRLHENPPVGTNPVTEAMSCFDALDETQSYQFIQEIKTRMSEETWKLFSE